MELAGKVGGVQRLRTWLQADLGLPARGAVTLVSPGLAQAGWGGAQRGLALAGSLAVA